MVTLAKAIVRLYKKERGRKTPFNSGYRPIFSFTGKETKTFGQITLIDREEFYPGDEGEVEIKFLSKFLAEDFCKGRTFIFSEGEEPLGEGIINEMLGTSVVNL